MSNLHVHNYFLYNGNLSYSDIKPENGQFDSKVYVVPYRVPDSWNSHKNVQLEQIEYCSFGDYDNSGSIERANYKHVTDNYSELINVFIWECYGGYGQGLYTLHGLFELIENYPNVTAASLYRWLELTLGYSPERFDQDIVDQLVSLKEEVDGLRHYCVFDDEQHSNLERELTIESLFENDDYDILKMLDNIVAKNYPNVDAIYSDWIDDYPCKQSSLLKLYHWVESNGYAYYQNEGSYMYLSPSWESVFEKYEDEILELLHDNISEFILDYAMEIGANGREILAIQQWLNNETVEF
jgi:hypothetical protein